MRFPNSKKYKEKKRLEAEWKKLEPMNNRVKKKKGEESMALGTKEEFYRFVDDRVIWSRHLFILAKNTPSKVLFKSLTAKDELRSFDIVKKVIVRDDEGKERKIDKFVTEEKLTHVITLKGIVPIDQQALVIELRKRLKKDEFLKENKLLLELNIPVITAISKDKKSFTMEIILGTLKADRE